MQPYRRTEPPVTPGTSLFGVGGALLMLLFFMPWFSACNIAVTGKDLAFGLNTGFGTSTAGTYPWLAFVPLAGLVAVGLALFNMNQSLGTVKRRSIIAIGAGGWALLLLVIVGLGFLNAASNPQYSLVQLRIEFGFIASVLTAALIAIGGSLDLVGLNWAGFIASRASPPRAPAYKSPPYASPPTLPEPQPFVATAAQAWLIGQRGEFAGRRIPVGGDHWEIGRSANSHLRLSDTQVSRTHALVRYAQGRYFLQDQGSTMGTLVNGRPITAVALSDGDVIAIGDDMFVFRLGR